MHRAAAEHGKNLHESGGIGFMKIIACRPLALALSCLVAMLLLAACGGAGSVPPSQGNGDASPALSAPAQTSAPGIEMTEQRRQLLNALNEALAKYGNGTYPLPIMYHTEGSGFSAWPPPGVALPATAGAEEFSYELSFSEMWGTDFATVVLPLENAFSLQVTVALDGVGETAEVDFISGARFQDEQEGGEADSLPAELGGSFTGVKADRLSASCRFEKVHTASGQTISGSFTWAKGINFLWFYFDNAEGQPYAHMYTCYVEADGSLRQEYPTDEFRDVNNSPYTDAELASIAGSLYQQFGNALAATELDF